MQENCNTCPALPSPCQAHPPAAFRAELSGASVRFLRSLALKIVPKVRRDGALRDLEPARATGRHESDIIYTVCKRPGARGSGRLSVYERYL